MATTVEVEDTEAEEYLVGATPPPVVKRARRHSMLEKGALSKSEFESLIRWRCWLRPNLRSARFWKSRKANRCGSHEWEKGTEFEHRVANTKRELANRLQIEFEQRNLSQ